METPKTSAAQKTHAEWRDKILKTLGGSAWNVELDEQSIDHAIWQTLCLFNKYRPEWLWKPLGLVSNKMQINMSNEEKGVKVVDVKFQADNFQHIRPFTFQSPHVYQGLREPRRISNILNAQDRYNSFLGIQPAWHWDESKRTLFLTVMSNISGLHATALLLVPLRIDQISFALETDFLQGAVGYSKLILARMFRKFGGGIPSSQGSISLDGNELQNEGEKAIDDLEKKLDRNLRHMPPKPIF